MNELPNVRQRPSAAEWLERAFTPIDRLFGVVYGTRWNPLNHSGSLAIVCFLGLVISGLYLFLFYKVANPYASVQAIQGQWWAGRWIRSFHRYASDCALVATAVHAFKMFVAGKTWGPRMLAWVSGFVLVGATLLTGWTGMVMVWDVQGQLVAVEGAKLLDLVPIFSEPISRSFVRYDAMPPSFFFMNLFLHVAAPLGLVLLLWLHTSRLARPKVLPPRIVASIALATLVLVAMLWPVPMLPAADLQALPGRVVLDLFYGFWIPLARVVPSRLHAALWVAGTAVVLTAPLWWRPRRAWIKPSIVDTHRCTGCTQCYQDCPYDAISMVPREPPSRLSETVAQVDPVLCVGCGICAAACAPMGIGVPGLGGRDQLAAARRFMAEHRPTGREVIVAGCALGVGGAAASEIAAMPGVLYYPTACSGSFHTSTIELLVRCGYGGVYVLSCAPEDCQYREGAVWLHERMYNDREAELKARVDRKRVHLGAFSRVEVLAALASIAAFSADIHRGGVATGEADVALDEECEAKRVA